MIKRLIKNKQGRMMMSILWGLGLAALFNQACKGRNCIIYTSQNPNIVKNNIYQSDNDKCYKFDSEVTECNKNSIEHIVQ